MPRTWLLSLWTASLLLPSLAGADDPLPDGTEAGKKRIPAFRIPAGLKVELFAAEPMLASPVAICLDEQGRVYAAEEHRFNRGTEENRTRPFLLEDDLQIQTVEDRLKMYEKYADKFDGGMAWFSKWADQVRLVEDRDGDGVADKSSIFAGPFNAPLDGLAAGVIARDGNVFLTCIPNLWHLRDTDGDGVADVKKSMHTGFGVNAAFLGHDLHGLAWGPDGKLYFSVGDRGYHVKTLEGTTLHGPRNGAVFRCDPDGKNLEVVHRGLRNPQELAFDVHGNLFADDNNCDKGDHARLVYVVEGGTSGWNMAFQTIPDPYLTGPWHAERMWHLANPGQPAWLVPPVGKLGAGPSGFAYYPGVGLPEKYAGCFFMANYTGNGGIEAIGVREQGAGFEIVTYEDFLKPIMATDVDFGYDGKVYIADFVNLDWAGKSLGGRIYTLHDPNLIREPVVSEVRRLFHDGFTKRPVAELASLLDHADMRVRQRAQFALADRGAESDAVFVEKALKSGPRLPRLHAIWGVGQRSRHTPELAAKLLPLLDDEDVEVRAQAAKVLGEQRTRSAADKLVAALSDAAPRVRFFAAQALGKLQHEPAIGPLFDMLKANDNADPYLRHAGVTALEWIDQRDAVAARAKDEHAAVRLAVLLVQRRWADERIFGFLNDAEAFLVTEAARAINDLPLDAGNTPLAALTDRFATGAGEEAEPLFRRALHAAFRLGTAEDVRRVARVAANPAHTNRIRTEAVGCLLDWIQPSQRDRVNGYWRPLANRSLDELKPVFQEVLPALLASATGDQLTKTADLIAKYQLTADESTFVGWVEDAKQPLANRVAGLQLLAARKSPRFDKLLSKSLADADPKLRAGARDLLAKSDPPAGLAELQRVLEAKDAAVVERQRVFGTLASMETGTADEILVTWLTRLRDEEPVEPAIQVDILDAAAVRGTPPLKALLDDLRNRRKPGDPVYNARQALVGGDAERGRLLFRGHTVGQCMRCHKVGDEGGGVAGPDLTKAADRHREQTREFFLQSLVDPSAQIAPGFGSVALELTSGKVVVGIIKSEEGGVVTLETPDGKQEKIPVKEIEDRSQPKSAMPAMDRALTLRELRDLVEYLTTLK